jgi:hypothetical protein
VREERKERKERKERNRYKYIMQWVNINFGKRKNERRKNDEGVG